MRELKAKIKNSLDFNEMEIAGEIGDFEITQENEKSVTIESEFGVEYKVTWDKMTNQISLKEVF